MLLLPVIPVHYTICFIEERGLWFTPMTKAFLHVQSSTKVLRKMTKGYRVVSQKHQARHPRVPDYITSFLGTHDEFPKLVSWGSVALVDILF